ncbi:ABC transporter ATP-binding protein [Natrialbaceae archaeon AArc-T1-2]|uniref:ABC transporter ATP-binding protein n=1 Tax=Natrialbaceae archaeon AArc-T1-2 TaxID=3053904 RepID=UPI00255A8B9B|nr:ABC transporter ATP-binding protein [Natrialbaceae archaeon AArc-T1-2]WIV67248.1 ABC transporter ATP-binding protein [Natrialbaceae archaeon AArc-T1-2]
MTDNVPMLEAANVAKSYGDVPVLEDVSLEIPEGQVTALIGPNGSGKSTLIRTLIGIHEPTDGKVVYHGPETTRPIGYLPQRPSFRPGFTVRETLSFYAELVGDDEAVAMDHLRRIGMEAAAERPVEALSGGMTRLLGIAQATIGDPPVIVLDEPASGLDPGMSVHVFDVVADLATDGTAVLLSSHDLALVERTVDRVALLDEGKIVERGDPADIRDRLEVDSLLDVYETSVAGEAGTVRVRGESA